MRNTIILFAYCLLLVSCAPNIYQLSSVKSNNVFLDNNRKFAYRDSSLIITYNLWSDGGTMSFSIYNNTNAPLYIDWNKSNFIRNGISADYYKDVEATKIKGVSSKKGTQSWYSNNPYSVNSVAHSESTFDGIIIRQKDKPNNQIPPHAALIVSRFEVNSPFWLLPKYPKTNDSAVLNCDSSKTLLSFRNYIAYTKNQDLSNVKFIDNSFWVDKVTCLNKTKYSRNFVTGANTQITGEDVFTNERARTNSFYTVYNLNDLP